MKYKIINTAILASRDIPQSVIRDNNFFKYLLNNSVAYYYSKYLSEEKNTMDKRIITIGDNLNGKFLKTLKLINKVGKEKNIKFLLFKTYKYFPEVVDNDIDLIIKERDFYRLTEALQQEGFSCIENEHLNAICLKEGFCKIEPRVRSSSRGVVILNEKEIWANIDHVNISGMQILKTKKEVDLLHLMLSILYNPNYLKLYVLLLYRICDIKILYSLSSDRKIHQDLRFLLSNLITNNIENQRFPRFLGNISFTIWWYKRILSNPKISLFSRLRLIIFFFYAKYLYLIFNKLVFKHPWPLN